MDAPKHAGSETALTGPLERRRYLDVVEEVLRSVAVGSVAVGDRLPGERFLADRCGVSRSTAREAILALELSGVIEVRPGRGCFFTGMGVRPVTVVASTGDTSPKDLLEVRQTIEPLGARLAAARIERADIGRLVALIDEAQREGDAATSDKFDQFLTLSLVFHRELARTSGNTILASVTGHLVDVGAHPLWFLVDGIAVRNPATRARQVAEHRAIVDAISRGDADGAAEAMAIHLGALSARIFGPEMVPLKIRRARRRRA